MSSKSADDPLLAPAKSLPRGIAAPNPLVGISLETTLRAFGAWGGGILRHPARIADIGAKLVIDSVKLRQGPRSTCVRTVASVT